MSTPPLRKPVQLRAAAHSVVQRLRDSGFAALFAGGCVRDLLMKRRPKDYDVATDARPEQVIGLFRRTRAVGKKFGVILVGVGPHWIEVATFRSDASYSDGRHPDAVRFSNAEEDAQRRDFTINGMFYDPIARQVIDHVGGEADLRAGLIRAIRDPNERFSEDHLRLLRAVRFAARLGFAIEAATFRAIQSHAGMLVRVSAERIRQELEHMLSHPARATAWKMLGESGLMGHLWRGSSRFVARAADTERLLAHLPESATFECALAAVIIPDDVRQADADCDKLRTSNDTKARVSWLVRNHSALDDPNGLGLADLKLLMAGPAFGELLALLRARLREADQPETAWTKIRQRARAIPESEVRPPPLATGNDLAGLSVSPGPEYKRILDAAYYAQLSGEIRDRKAARAFVRRMVDERH